MPDLIIAPEGLRVAQAYLEHKMNSMDTALALQLPHEEVMRYLKTPEVKRYIDHVFEESGYRNKTRLQEIMNIIIDKKLEEIEETGMITDKDILDILAFQHKMRMDELKLQLELEKAAAKDTPTVQTNVQVNSYGGDNYQALLRTILDPKQTR